MTVDKNILNSIKITPLLDTLRLENISDDEYFSEKYTNYLSNSRLNLLKTKGVKVFFEGLKNEYNPSFAFGTALHQLVLQPESFELVDSVFKPTAKAGVVADFLYNLNGLTSTDDDIKKASIDCNYYKDKLTINRLNDFKSRAEIYWRDRYIFEQNNPKDENKERIYTDEKSVGLLKSCLESLDKDTQIQELLHPKGLVKDPYVANEQAILIDLEIQVPDYEPIIYKWKSKLDNFSIDEEENIITVNDLKTTSKLVKEFDLRFFSYQRELAIYSWLLKYCSEKFFGLSKPKIRGNFLVVSIIPNFNTMVYPMTPELYRIGFEEFKYLLKTIAYFNIVEKYEFQ